MKIRIASVASALVFVLGLGILPAHAQGQGPNNQQLLDKIAGLAARVARLEGNISASDLVGTYAVHTIDTVVAAAGTQGGVAPQVSTGTVTLNADGTGMLVGGACGGFTLLVPPPSVTPIDCSGQVTYPFGWSYADGILTESVFGTEIPFNVGVAGRVMTTTFTFMTGPQVGHADFIILTRLK